MMTRSGLFTLLVSGALLRGALPAAAWAASDVDVLSYEIHAVIGAESITETVSVRAAATRPARELAMELADCMEIRSCKIGEADVPFERDGWNLLLDLAKAGAPRGEFEVVFQLEGRPYNNQRNQFIRTTVSKEHAYIRSQYAWYPRVREDLALYQTTLDVRKDWQVRTEGELVEKAETGDRAAWRFVLEKPCRAIGLAAGDYVSVERRVEGSTALDALVFAGHEEGGRQLLEFAARAIELYQGLFGPMSEKRFSLVEMPAAFGEGSGYGMTGYALIGTGAFAAGGGAAWAESLVAHEVAHTWWGREVGFSNFANEMLATYSTNRYIERFGGEEKARAEREGFCRNVLETVAAKGAVALDDIQGWGGPLDPAVYTAHAYDKGAMVLVALEREMGRKAFDAALAAFCERHRGQVVDYRTLCDALGGSGHKWVFEQWGGPEIPSLREEHEVKKAGSSFSIRGTLVQEGTKKPFRMSVTLRAACEEKSVDLVVQVKQEKTPFKLTCPFEPERIEVDPDRLLVLGRGNPDVDLDALAKRAFDVVNNPKMADRSILERTIEDLDRLIELGGGKKSECIAGKGRCLFRLGRLDEAEEELERAIGMGDSGPFWQGWIHLRLGNIADLKGRRSAAEDHYEKVVALPDASNLKYQKELAGRFLKQPYRGYEKDG
ncbi:MAG: hypothetical protein HY812_01795 [Planctomycetes bacterium]|nr:hypothetical protein [Planctomycetota bacterium]